MSAASQELLEILDQLPEEKAREVVDFARFLKEQAGDLAWEKIIADASPRKKLDSFVTTALHEGSAEPLDPNQL
jgi:hypothetical protein